MVFLHKNAKKYLTLIDLKFQHLTLTILTFITKTASKRNVDYEDWIH